MKTEKTFVEETNEETINYFDEGRQLLLGLTTELEFKTLSECLNMPVSELKILQAELKAMSEDKLERSKSLFIDWKQSIPEDKGYINAGDYLKNNTK